MVLPPSPTDYRVPTDLKVQDTVVSRVMIVGSCMVAGWSAVLEKICPGATVDYFGTNNVGQLPEEMPAEPIEYSFQVVQVPLRSVLPENLYFKLSYANKSAYDRLYDDSIERLQQLVSNAMRWNVAHGLLTFVPNFVVPQQNPMGRLLPRYDLRNMVYFVERLNQELDAIVAEYRNSYLLDVDAIIATNGKRHFNDEVMLQFNHGSGLTDGFFEEDQVRLEPPQRATGLYQIRLYENVVAICSEMLACFRTIRQMDSVKIVIMDLDDTLWRGVAGEKASLRVEDLEGWPLGIVEALGYLKRRGILIATASKNDEAHIRQLWRAGLEGRFSFDDFAVSKINWLPKAHNIEEILSEVNLLPHNALFVDDNPVERAAVQAAFPEIRAIGSSPYTWRRILLWSSETQVPSITRESASRTEMVRAQVRRETQRRKLTREEFLATLEVRIALFVVLSIENIGFDRALELVNKTNQFNTTGRRWTREGCAEAFASGIRFHTFEVNDRFTEYGSVGVVITSGLEIVQVVMSCRVVGLEVELAVIAELLRVMRQEGATVVTARLQETALNLLCRDLFMRCGFIQEGDVWVRDLAELTPPPAHVVLTPAAGSDIVAS